MELTVRESTQTPTDSTHAASCSSVAATTIGDQEENESCGSGEMVKKKKKHGKKKKENIIITDDDFGPLTDFTKKEGFVYDPTKAEFDINEVRFEKRPWEIPDVRSVLYLRRLERKHNKLVHGLASVRKLTPKQILKEESRSY